MNFLNSAPRLPLVLPLGGRGESRRMKPIYEEPENCNAPGYLVHGTWYFCVGWVEDTEGTRVRGDLSQISYFGGDLFGQWTEGQFAAGR